MAAIVSLLLTSDRESFRWKESGPLWAPRWICQWVSKMYSVYWYWWCMWLLCLVRYFGYEPVGMKLEDLISMTRIGDPGLEETSTRRCWGGEPPVLPATGRGACWPAWDRESSLVWVSPLWLNISIGIDSSPFPVEGDTKQNHVLDSLNIHKQSPRNSLQKMPKLQTAALQIRQE